MQTLNYLAPGTIDEAVAAMAAAAGKGRILAGGTDLLVQMRAGTQSPGTIVDVKKIREMTEIAATPEGAFASAPPSPAR